MRLGLGLGLNRSIKDSPAVPALVANNAKALYAAYLNLNPFDSTKLLDQSPLHLGTRRAGQQGRGWHYDGTDDYSTAGDLSLNVKTIAFRVKPVDGVASGTAYLIDLNGTDYIKLSAQGLTGLIQTVGFSGATITKYVDGSVGAVISDDKFYSVVVVSGTGFSASDFEIGRLSGTGNSEFEIFDVRLSDQELTAGQVTNYHTFGASGDAVTWSDWWKSDEQSGVIGYDSAGGNNLTHTNITAANFHSTQDVWSFQNQVGYNLSGAVYIPRDESDPTNDVLGNPLTYTGIRPNDAALINSSCLTADGSLYIAAAHLVGTETVVRSGGTSTPSISAGRIDFTAGTCWDLLLSDGTYYPLADSWGTLISNAAVYGDNGVLTNATLANAWSATQDDFHYNLLSGHSRRMWFDAVDDLVSLGNVLDISDKTTVFRVKFTLIIDGPLTDFTYFLGKGVSLSVGGLSFRNSTSGNRQKFSIYASDGSNTSECRSQTNVFVGQGEYVIDAQWNGDGSSSLTVNGESILIDDAPTFAVLGSLSNSEEFSIGGREIDSGGLFQGIISDIEFYINGILKYKTDGYGNTDADWIDTSGNGNNPTVAGSPEIIRIPASSATAGLDALGNDLQFPAGSKFIPAETEINFNPDSTPEMGGQLGSYTAPAAHAFSDDMDPGSTDQGFARQATGKEDRFAIFPEPQTGAALTTIERWVS